MNQKILIMVNSAPYGSERTLSALRLANTLINNENRPELYLFFLSDAVITALANQKTADGNTLESMLSEIINSGAQARVCTTCVSARGIIDSKLVTGVKIGTMPELADLILWADKTITF